MGKLELLCLGEASTVDAVFRRDVVAVSFIVLQDGFPVVLIGAGAGVAHACMHYVNTLPDCILLLNASEDQTLELSSIVRYETQYGRRLRIVGAKQVIDSVTARLRTELEGCESVNVNSLQFVPLDTSGESPTPQPLVANFSVILHPCMSWASPGHPTTSAVLCYKEHLVVSFSGPTPFDAQHETRLCAAPFLVNWVGPVDNGNALPSPWDVQSFADNVNQNKRGGEASLIFLLAGSVEQKDASMCPPPYVVTLHPGTPVVLLVGEFVDSLFTNLGITQASVRKPLTIARVPRTQNAPNNNNPPRLEAPAIPTAAVLAEKSDSGDASVSQRGDQSGVGANYADPSKGWNPSDNVGGVDARRVWVFNNEDKGCPAKIIMLRKFRQLEHLKSHIAAITGLKPIKDILFANGSAVCDLARIPPNAELIVTKKGGASYNPRDLPRLMKSKVQ